jgi:hypothetical protein
MGYSIKAQIYLVLDHSENCNIKFWPPPKGQMGWLKPPQTLSHPQMAHGRPPILFYFILFFSVFISFYNGILGINTYIRGNFRIFVQKTHVQGT